MLYPARLVLFRHLSRIEMVFKKTNGMTQVLEKCACNSPIVPLICTKQLTIASPIQTTRCYRKLARQFAVKFSSLIRTWQPLGWTRPTQNQHTLNSPPKKLFFSSGAGRHGLGIGNLHCQYQRHHYQLDYRRRLIVKLANQLTHFGFHSLWYNSPQPRQGREPRLALLQFVECQCQESVKYI